MKPHQYTFSVTKKILLQGEFQINNNLFLYAIEQCKTKYPNHIIERIEHYYDFNEEPQEGGVHKWVIFLMDRDDINIYK